MRQEGETGLQTHVRSLLDYLQASGQATEVFTPYRAPRWQVYPFDTAAVIVAGWTLYQLGFAPGREK